MRTSLIFASLTALAVTACNDSSDQAQSGDISLAEAAERAGESGIKPLAGQYSATMEVLEVSIPGAPEGMADMMQGAMGGRKHSYCLTQEDVDKGFEEMAKQSQENDDCSFERFNVDDGRMDALMICNVEGQGQMTMEMTGTGSPTRSEMDMTMKGDVAGMGEMNMRMKATHERTGDCA